MAKTFSPDGFQLVKNTIIKVGTINRKKTFVVAAALLLGFLMPYISRIPYAFTFGFSWIWSYMPDSDAFFWWNRLHLYSLIPMGVFGLVFVFGNIRWGFYASAVVHFAA